MVLIAISRIFFVLLWFLIHVTDGYFFPMCFFCLLIMILDVIQLAGITFFLSFMSYFSLSVLLDYLHYEISNHHTVMFLSSLARRLTKNFHLKSLLSKKNLKEKTFEKRTEHRHVLQTQFSLTPLICVCGG